MWKLLRAVTDLIVGLIRQIKKEKKKERLRWSSDWQHWFDLEGKKNWHEVRQRELLLIKSFKAYIYAASYTHEPPDQVVGVGVIFFGGELRGVELGGSQDLQHALQGLGYRYWAVLLGGVDDIYYLRKKEHKSPHSAAKQTLHANTRTKSPLRDTTQQSAPFFMHVSWSCACDAEEIFSGAKQLNKAASQTHKSITGPAVGCRLRQCDILYSVRYQTVMQPAAWPGFILALCNFTLWQHVMKCSMRCFFYCDLFDLILKIHIIF